MKTGTLLLSLLFLIPAGAFAQTQELPGFVGIPWGASQDDAKKELMSRTHAHFDRPHSAAHELAFLGGRFAGFKMIHLKLMFAANSLWGAEFYLEAPSPKHEKEFAALKNMLTEKYGKPGRDESVGEGLEANWYFPVPGLPSCNLWIIQDPRGEGIKVIYLSEATKKTAGNAPGAKPAKPGKPASPASTKPSDKDDL